MSSPYPILDNRPIDQWKVTELREELKRRKLTTKGLKEDLVKRLDEAIRSEQESAQRNTGNDFDSANDSTVESEQERTESFDANKEKDASVACDLIGDKVENEVCKVDVGDNRMPSDDDKVVEGEPLHSIGVEVGQLSNVETNVMVGETVDSVMAFDGQDLENQGTQNEGDSKAELQNPVSKSSDVDAKIVSPEPNDQVSEFSPALEFHVNSDSVSTDISISEKIETKNNIITDVKLEVDVKPEMVHLSSSNVVPGSESHPMDVEEPHDNKLSVEQGSIDKINDMRDSGSSEKLHLGQKSGDASMEENVCESKQIDSKLDTEKNGDSLEMVNGKVVNPDVVRNHMAADEKVASIENKSEPTVQSAKRKADEEAVVSKGTVKRQRRWKSENIEIPQNQSGTIIASPTPKNASHPTFKRSLSMSNSMASEESMQERVVPPSPKPATNSLRIDQFLRPFTLKAVQELLGKTGTVMSFWMDNIKTHCYVSYSSVEEANETRNALYNLQWPPNGGRLLVAEFVDPLEVKVRVEGPPQSPVTPVTPVSTGSTLSAAPPAMQAQPYLRQQIQKKQLQPPPSLPPPPPLCNPPPVKERHPLPPPPPLPEKVDPPIVTLDDLFRKTKVTPRVYYLPLSNEQVEAKLKAQGKDTKL